MLLPLGTSIAVGAALKRPKKKKKLILIQRVWFGGEAPTAGPRSTLWGAQSGPALWRRELGMAWPRGITRVSLCSSPSGGLSSGRGLGSEAVDAVTLFTFPGDTSGYHCSQGARTF